MKKKLRISFNGKTYDVEAEVLDEDSTHAAAPVRPIVGAGAIAAEPSLAANVAPAAARVGTAHGALPSPLAGRVVSIDATVGTRVRKDQTVITLEAMKMNTIVSSPSDGTVTSVHVNVGDSVEEGQPLLTIA
jgi:biotin carboxyl carrier protein